MKNNETNQHRLYYTIGEVADYFNVNESLLRFWEKEFDIINPRKSSKGTRYYSPVDIENIRLIYYLTKEKGLTLSGAKKKLKENKDGVIRNHEIINHLKNIKSELIAIRDEFSVIEEISESDDTHNI